MHNPEQARNQSWQAAKQSRRAAIAAIGTELMKRWNTGTADPSLMACLGRDTTTGYEFCIERDGVVFTVAVTRDLDT